jgi:hypothetical protein
MIDGKLSHSNTMSAKFYRQQQAERQIAANRRASSSSHKASSAERTKRIERLNERPYHELLEIARRLAGRREVRHLERIVESGVTASGAARYGLIYVNVWGLGDSVELAVARALTD